MTPSASLSPFVHTASHGTDVPPSSATQARTLETLSCLLRYPLLRARDLSVLMGLSLSATAARLAHAQADGLVRTLPASLLGRSVANLCALTPAGLEVLARRYGPVVWRQARRHQADPEGLLRLIPRLPGLLITQSFTLALITHAPEIASETTLRQHHLVVDTHCAASFAPNGRRATVGPSVAALRCRHSSDAQSSGTPVARKAC